MKTKTLKVMMRVPAIGEAVFGIIPEMIILGLPKMPEIIRVGTVTTNTFLHHDQPIVDLWTKRNEITEEVHKFEGYESNAFLYLEQIVPIWN